MNLFTIESGIVTPVPETLLIFPFDKIWERDSTAHKDNAIREFTYIEFLCSYKKSNPFSGFKNEVKEQRVKASVFKANPDWAPDDLVLEAIEVYRNFQKEASPSLRFYEAALEGITKLQDYFTTLDMTETTNQGSLVNKPSDVARALTQTSAILQNLESLREKVNQELFESNKTRANRTVNPFER